jgi:hypothetical protein
MAPGADDHPNAYADRGYGYADTNGYRYSNGYSDGYRWWGYLGRSHAGRTLRARGEDN